MRRLSKAFLIAALMVTACTATYDDSAIRKDITDLRKRMEEVEKRLDGINADISSLRQLVTALESGKQLLSVNEVTADGETFWELVFSDGKTITIHNGKDGADGKDGANGKDGKDGADGADGKDGEDGKDGADGHSPVIGVKQFTDGLWYWTLDGEWLLDGNGNKVRATGVDGQDGKDGKDGADGITPQLKIEDGFWWVSYDNGSSWTKLYEYSSTPVATGPVEDIDTTSSSQYVIVRLTGGETINIPRYVQLSIAFGKEEIVVVTPGSSIEIPYTLTGGTDSNVVKAFGQGGWIAGVTPADAHSGVITVTAPETIVSCEIIVLANDGAGYTALASLDCVKGEIRFAEESAHVAAAGGSVEIPLETNVEAFTVETDAPWIHYVETKAFTAKTVTLSVDANTGEERFASVLFKQGATLISSVILFQDAKGLPQAFGVWTPADEPVYAYNPAVAQMNLYEAAGQFWFRFVEPATLMVREIGPIPSEPVLGGVFNATFAKIQAGVTLSSDEMEFTVRYIGQEKLILSSVDGNFFVIRF